MKIIDYLKAAISKLAWWKKGLKVEDPSDAVDEAAKDSKKSKVDVACDILDAVFAEKESAFIKETDGVRGYAKFTISRVGSTCVLTITDQVSEKQVSDMILLLYGTEGDQE